MNIRNLTHADVEAMWAINEDGLPGTGQVSPPELIALLDLASFAVGAFQDNSMLGFVICLPPRTTYGSLNYAWFNQRYDAFLYCLLYTSPSPRDATLSRMPSSA